MSKGLINDPHHLEFHLGLGQEELEAFFFWSQKNLSILKVYRLYPTVQPTRVPKTIAPAALAPTLAPVKPPTVHPVRPREHPE